MIYTVHAIASSVSGTCFSELAVNALLAFGELVAHKIPSEKPRLKMLSYVRVLCVFSFF